MSVANTFSTPNNTVGNLNGLFKECYADKLKDLVPDGVKLLKDVKFDPKAKQLGNLFHAPIIVGMEHGITFAGSDDDAFNLKAAISGSIKDAQVKGSPAVLRSVLGYSAASRAAAGKAAFEEATKYLIANMLRSMAKKIEIEMLYGQAGYGLVSAVDGTNTQLTVKTSEWAPGIWAGAEGMPVEIRDTTGATSRGTAKVKSVNMDTRVITLESAVPGIVTTLSSEDVIWHDGAYGNEFVGIHKILSQSTGTLFNIDIAKYNLFKGNSYSAGSGPLSFTKLNLAAARAVEKGLDSKLMALVNVRTWANILNTQEALRMYDQSYSAEKNESGSRKLLFHSQNGEIQIEPSIYVKEGYAYLLSMEDWIRVGSSDITFQVPGQKDEFFRHLESAAGYELRAWTDQAVFCMAPGRSVLVTDIVNATS